MVEAAAEEAAEEEAAEAEAAEAGVAEEEAVGKSRCSNQDTDR